MIWSRLHRYLVAAKNFPKGKDDCYEKGKDHFKSTFDVFLKSKADSLLIIFASMNFGCVLPTKSFVQPKALRSGLCN